MEVQETANAAEGVTQEQAAPMPEEASPASENVETQGEENLPFGKHPRWQKMLAENKKYSSEVAKLQGEMTKLEKAQALDRYLTDLSSSNPQKFQRLVQVLEDQAEAQQQSNAPLSIEALAQEVAQIKEFKQQQEYRSVMENQQSLDSEFDSAMEKAGYLKDGKPVDSTSFALLQKATVSMLSELTNGQPYLASKQDLQNCLKTVLSGVQAIQRTGLKQTMQTTKAVPPTGSKSGSPSGVQANVNTEEGRLSVIESILRGQ